MLYALLFFSAYQKTQPKAIFTEDQDEQKAAGSEADAEED